MAMVVGVGVGVGVAVVGVMLLRLALISVVYRVGVLLHFTLLCSGYGM